VPKILKGNKQIIYGIIIGLFLCSFFGVKVEGVVNPVTEGELVCPTHLPRNIKQYIDSNKIPGYGTGAFEIFADSVCKNIHNWIETNSSPTPYDICKYLEKESAFSADIRNRKKCSEPENTHCRLSKKKTYCDKNYPISSSPS
tara:strand:+ start:2139 stop:2567 length:429 start_codon:yes stop_codon:yes gene_type:complete